MTKVKDLVDVIVDSAFAAFPVDSERYELRGVLEDRLNEVFNTPQQRLFENVDERLRDWVAISEALIERAIMCALLQVAGTDLSKSHRKLASRFFAALDKESNLMENFSFLCAKYGKHYHMVCVLGEVSQRLRNPNA